MIKTSLSTTLHNHKQNIIPQHIYIEKPAYLFLNDKWLINCVILWATSSLFDPVGKDYYAAFSVHVNVSL